MKVAVTSQGPDLTSQVDPRFGRAKCFVVVDTDTGQFAAHDNQKNMDAVQGAGIQAGRTVIKLGAGALVTGHIGPKAFDTLQAAGVKVYSGVSGTVEDAIGVFKRDGLETVDKPDVEGHWA